MFARDTRTNDVALIRWLISGVWRTGEKKPEHDVNRTVLVVTVTVIITFFFFYEALEFYETAIPADFKKLRSGKFCDTFRRFDILIKF